jgi:predicted ATP-grasp superfamily ATP-dependent carboligase
VPCDERAVSVIDYWIGGSQQDTPLTSGLRECLVSSLGDPKRLAERSSKLQTLELARLNGVRTPREVKVTSRAECEQAAATFGYPVILKLSHGAGGNGVRLCRTPEQLAAAFQSFERGRSIIKTWRRRLLRRDWFGSWFDIMVQEYVPGRPAMRCTAAFAGRSLSIVTGIAEEVTEPMGPASIVRIVDIPEIRRMTQSMVKAFQASGFLSFDFIVDDAGSAVLLECNARPTQIMHLGHLVDVDLAKALRGALQGTSDAPCETPRGEREVAFFPHEWKRNPESSTLATGFHDVPWEDPKLLRAILGKRPVNWRRRHIP